MEFPKDKSNLSRLIRIFNRTLSETVQLEILELISMDTVVEIAGKSTQKQCEELVHSARSGTVKKKICEHITIRNDRKLSLFFKSEESTRTFELEESTSLRVVFK